MTPTLALVPGIAADPDPQRARAALLAAGLTGAGYTPQDASLFVRDPVLASLLAEEMELARVASESARLIYGIGS